MNIRITLAAMVFGASLLPAAAASSANPFLYAQGIPGFIVLPEQRFDPAVQRYMAEQSLRAMPLRDGQLYYVYPIDSSNAYVEQMQIRYLEALLDKSAANGSDKIEPESN